MNTMLANSVLYIYIYINKCVYAYRKQTILQQSVRVHQGIKKSWMCLFVRMNVCGSIYMYPRLVSYSYMYIVSLPRVCKRCTLQVGENELFNFLYSYSSTWIQILANSDVIWNRKKKNKKKHIQKPIYIMNPANMIHHCWGTPQTSIYTIYIAHTCVWTGVSIYIAPTRIYSPGKYDVAFEIKLPSHLPASFYEWYFEFTWSHSSSLSFNNYTIYMHAYIAYNHHHNASCTLFVCICIWSVYMCVILYVGGKCHLTYWMAIFRA